ncbi:MAG: hypothetical protein WC797_02895 [Candidatus Paceibacterota bacterium]|jgi:hypothetical protein
MGKDPSVPGIIRVWFKSFMTLTAIKKMMRKRNFLCSGVKITAFGDGSYDVSVPVGEEIKWLNKFSAYQAIDRAELVCAETVEL